jgi:flavin-dependent dehydrogenase
MKPGEEADAISFDIVVYGATPGGIAAACRAAGNGRVRVALVEASPFIGGHLTSGICTT